MVAWGRLALVGALVAVGALATGCRYGFNAQDTVNSDDATLSQSINEVHVAAGPGDVVIRAGSGSTTSVHRELHYNGNHKPGATSVTGGALSLNGCGDNCTVDYTVTVPAAAKVDGATSSGDVEISGVASVDIDGSSGDVDLTRIAGKVDVATTSGRVRISQAGGDVETRSGSGDQDVDQVTGALIAQSQSGRVVAGGLRGARSAVYDSSGDVTIGADVAQDVDAGTTSGNIVVAVPSGSYRVSATSTSGDRRVDLANDPNGAHAIRAQSTSGDIHIRVS